MKVILRIIIGLSFCYSPINNVISGEIFPVTPGNTRPLLVSNKPLLESDKADLYMTRSPSESEAFLLTPPRIVFINNEDSLQSLKKANRNSIIVKSCAGLLDAEGIWIKIITVTGDKWVEPAILNKTEDTLSGILSDSSQFTLYATDHNSYFFSMNSPGRTVTILARNPSMDDKRISLTGMLDGQPFELAVEGVASYKELISTSSIHTFELKHGNNVLNVDMMTKRNRTARGYIASSTPKIVKMYFPLEENRTAVVILDTGFIMGPFPLLKSKDGSLSSIVTVGEMNRSGEKVLFGKAEIKVNLVRNEVHEENITQFIDINGKMLDGSGTFSRKYSIHLMASGKMFVYHTEL